MESKTWLTQISKMITSAIIGMEHPRAIPAVAAADNPLLFLLFFVGVTTVLLTHFALSAEDVNKAMYH